MKLDTPHHYEKPATIGVTTGKKDGKTKHEINVSMDGTVLHIQLNEVQAKHIVEELQR